MQAVSNAFAPFIDGDGLKIGVLPGTALVGNTPTQVGNSTISLTANTINYVSLDPTSGIISVSTAGFPGGSYPIAQVTTGSTGITALIDSRCDVAGITGFRVLPQNAQTGTSYSIADGDRGKFVTFSNTSAIAVTLPRAGASNLFVSGWYCYVENLNTGLATITPITSTINGMPQIVLGQYQSAMIASDGTNYQATFTKIASTDAASALSSYVTTDAGPAAAQNQIVVQDLSAAGVNTKRKGLNIYLETAAQASTNCDGLQVNVGATITANTSASAGHVDAAEFLVQASGTAVTLPQINALKLRTSVLSNTKVSTVKGVLLYLPIFASGSEVTDYRAFGIDAPTGGGTVTNFIGVDGGGNYNNITVTNAVGVYGGTHSGADSTVTNSYGVLAQAKTASIVADDVNIATSFIGHGNVNADTYPITLHDGWYAHTSGPNGAASAAVGSMYSQQDGAVSTPFWVKTTGSGNTGWGSVVPNVASIDVAPQPGSISPTTLYAVPSNGAGVYRVTYSLICTTSGSGGTVTLTVTNANGTTTNSQTTSTLALTSTGELSGVLTGYSAASQNIIYSTTVSGAAGSPQYALHARVEAL